MQNKNDRILVIGTSLGGLSALSTVLTQLPKDFPAPVFVVMHLNPNSPSMLDKILDARVELRVKFAENGEVAEGGTVYIASPDQHLIVEKDRISTGFGPRENRFRPSIDTLFRSAAVNYGKGAIGVILTGMLDDGIAGLSAIKQCGGITVIQDPAEALSPEMPENAKNMVEIDHILSLGEMGRKFIELVNAPIEKDEVKIPQNLALETKIAGGMISEDIEQNIIGEPIPAICPDCGGTLSEIDEGSGLVRYRCHEGHAYSHLSLVDAQRRQTEYSLWVAVRSLEEQANTLMRLAKRGVAGRDIYSKRAEEARNHARNIKEFLLNNHQA